MMVAPPSQIVAAGLSASQAKATKLPTIGSREDDSCLFGR
jgi:hypothetical protein